MSYYVRLIGHTAFVDNISRTLAVKATATLWRHASRAGPDRRGRTYLRRHPVSIEKTLTNLEAHLAASGRCEGGNTGIPETPFLP